MVLIRQAENGDLFISHAEDNIHEINIIAGLATIILTKKQEGENPESEWNQAIQHSAQAIISVCNLIKDIAAEEERENHS